MEELSQAAMLRIDTAEQLAFVEAEAERVIGLPCARFPLGPLPSEDDRQAVKVRHECPVNGFVDGEQAGLVREELADRDLLRVKFSANTSRMRSKPGAVWP